MRAAICAGIPLLIVAAAFLIDVIVDYLRRPFYDDEQESDRALRRELRRHR